MEIFYFKFWLLLKKRETIWQYHRCLPIWQKQLELGGSLSKARHGVWSLPQSPPLPIVSGPWPIHSPSELPVSIWFLAFGSVEVTVHRVTLVHGSKVLDLIAYNFFHQKRKIESCCIYWISPHTSCPSLKLPCVLKMWVGYSFSWQQLGPLKSLRPRVRIPSWV